MNNLKQQLIKGIRGAALSIIALLLCSCSGESNPGGIPSLLDAHGEGARLISEVWWVQFWTATAVVLLVVGLIGAILVRHARDATRSARAHEADARPSSGMRWIYLGGIALPVVVLLIVFPLTVNNSLALSASPDADSTTITIIGHRWWWEVQYPEQGITSANELTIPVGQRVKVNLTSEDVIHSFWVPELHFKRDLINGQMNSTWLQANDAGTYRGICSEFCGLEHAKMMFMVNAVPPEQFEAWLAEQQQPARPPQTDAERLGQEIFLSNTCVYCHTVKGTPAAGETGPNLTHFASRKTIAAGTLENNIGNLGGWIMDPQHIKPGSAMPSTPLTGDELQALLAYLTSLK